MSYDVNLFYSGGSGGFFCLHLLLLTGRFQCVFEGDEQDFEKIFQSQWAINSELWKSTETKPDNPKTLLADFPNKIYRVCSNIDEWKKYPGKKILLYTDIDTQWFLAKTKNANWFVDEYNIVNRFNSEFKTTYNNVKSDVWPECNSIEDFKKLPNDIKHECIELFGFDQYWDFNKPDTIYSLLSARSKKYKEDYVYHSLVDEDMFSQAEIIIKLQDLIKFKGETLFNQLGISGNDKTRKFVEQWLSLHTAEQLSYLI